MYRKKFLIQKSSSGGRERESPKANEQYLALLPIADTGQLHPIKSQSEQIKTFRITKTVSK